MAQYNADDVAMEIWHHLDPENRGVFAEVIANRDGTLTVTTNGGQEWRISVVAVGGKIPNITAVRPEGERIRPLQPHTEGIHPLMPHQQRAVNFFENYLLPSLGKTRPLAEDVSGTVTGRMEMPRNPADRQQIPNPKKRLIGVDEKDYINGGL